MVKRTNLPRRGTTREGGGVISASRRKNTVKESRIEMDKETWSQNVGKHLLTKFNVTFSPLSEGR